jgi:hypothetical protein
MSALYALVALAPRLSPLPPAPSCRSRRLLPPLPGPYSRHPSPPFPPFCFCASAPTGLFFPCTHARRAERAAIHFFPPTQCLVRPTEYSLTLPSNRTSWWRRGFRRRLRSFKARASGSSTAFLAVCTSLRQVVDGGSSSVNRRPRAGKVVVSTGAGGGEGWANCARWWGCFEVA